ncbi:MAG: hypothetical protein U0K50_05420 [Segatella copri]|nr:hypothetical protein [Segatella copri]
MDYTDCGLLRTGVNWLNRHIDELEEAECTPGLIVVDEAHHAIADSYQDLFDRNRKA